MTTTVYPVHDGGHLGGFQFGALLNMTVVNFLVYDKVFLGFPPGSRMAALYLHLITPNFAEEVDAVYTPGNSV